MRTKCHPDLISCTGFSCAQLPQCADDSKASSIAGCDAAAAPRADTNWFWWVDPRIQIEPYLVQGPHEPETWPVDTQGPSREPGGYGWENWEAPDEEL